MKARGTSIRATAPYGASLLNPALVPTPLVNGDAVDAPQVAPERGGGAARTPAVAVALAALVLRLAWRWLRGRLGSRDTGRLVAAFCQRQGVLWIKVAQLLSMRVDLLTPGVIDELSRLQDRAVGFSGAAAVRAVEADLGRPVADVFSEFDAEPFAAASIAQVHRARLRDSGVLVAVKVRRPGIEQAFAGDMRVLRGLAAGLRLLIRPHAGWDELLWEAEQMIREELDYHIEASNQRRLRRALRRHRVYVPRIFRAWSGTQVLVMEFIPGVLMTDYLRVARTDPGRVAAWARENDSDTPAVGRRLLSTYLRQLLEDNLFHSDLHPGNLMLLREGRLALLDCGSLGTNEREFLRRYALFVDALVTGRHAVAVDVFLLFARYLPPIQLAGIKQELVEVLQSWSTRSSAIGLPYDQRSASTLTDQLVRTLDAHGITITWTFLRIGRAWTTMDASLRALAPDQDWRPVMARALRKKDRRGQAPAVRTLVDAAFAVAPLDLPSLLYERGIFRGATVRRLAQVFEGSTTVAAQLVAGVFRWSGRGLALAAAWLALQCLGQYLGAPKPAPFGWLAADVVPRLELQVWALVFAGLVHAWRTCRHLAARFSEPLMPGEHE